MVLWWQESIMPNSEYDKFLDELGREIQRETGDIPEPTKQDITQQCGRDSWQDFFNKNIRQQRGFREIAGPVLFDNFSVTYTPKGQQPQTVSLKVYRTALRKDRT
jgi:hypothetical protein